MLKNSVLDATTINSINNDIDSYSEQSQFAISNAFITSNSIYNEASSVEDVMVTELLSMSSQIESIKFIVSADNVTFVESFESLDFFDKKFHVDNPCSVDTNNKTLTLPEKSTVVNKFISALVEPGSNGTFGNSLKSFANTDLGMIFDDNATSMFEYEKYTNAFTSEPLLLSLTLKLDSEVSTNALYIKLFTENGIKSPTIDALSISKDGITFKDISFNYTQNQTDYFLRYIASRTRFVRIRFSQQEHQEIQTDFGTNFRYAIGIRQIQSFSTEYNIRGEYVSIPLASTQTFSTVSFTAVDEKVRFDDITYAVSANNGGKWLPIKSGETLDFYKVDSGVPVWVEIDAIRVKISASKLISGNFDTREEIVTSVNDTYQLRSIPYNILALVGGHISFGDAKPLTIRLDIPNTLQPSEFNQECILDFPTKATVNLVPYYSGMELDIEVRLNGSIITPINEITGQPNFIFTSHTNNLNSIIVFNFTSTGLKTEYLTPGEGGDVLVARKSFSVDLTYKPFVYRREDAAVTGNIIKLPYPSLYSDLSNINIEAIGYGDIPNQTSLMATQGQYDDLLVDFSNLLPLYRVSDSVFWIDLNVQSKNSWIMKTELENFQHIFSYSISPKFNYDTVSKTYDQTFTPMGWQIYGKAKMLNADGVNWDSIWILIDTIKDHNWTNQNEESFKLSSNCAYKEFLIIFTDSHLENLNGVPTSNPLNDTININSFHMNIASPQQLISNVDFTLSANKENIILNDSAYSFRKDYKITYYHGININSLLPANITTSQLNISGIPKSTNQTSVVAKYEYQNQTLLSDIRYYSPICKEYRVTLI